MYPHHVSTSYIHIISSTLCRPQHFVYNTRSTSYDPHHTGESLKKAVKEGRFDLADYTPPKGATRGQVRLVPLQPPNDIDTRSVFVCVCAADYCRKMKVPLTLILTLELEPDPSS